ncbi:SoxS protein [Paracoccus homiensis]|uniref:SoxS protein n=1 Tax=Paracoccus homiensis TaxID=364199 RepID=UPI00398CF14A
MSNCFVQYLRAFFLALLIGAAAGPIAAHAQAPDMTVANWTEQPVRLLMIDQRGCVYCARWDREIGPGYDRSKEGRRAPLMRVDIDGPWPDGLALARRPTMTPTFILLRNGQEISRLEGYPGAQYFYPLIDDMLDRVSQVNMTKGFGG